MDAAQRAPSAPPGGGVGPVRRLGRPPRSAGEREARRVALLERVMEAVRQHGPDLSMEELAAAAGVSKPVLYDEVGGRLALADAIAGAMADALEQVVLARLGPVTGIDFERAVRVTLDALVELTSSEAHLYTFLARSMRPSDRGFLDNAFVRVLHARADVALRALYVRGDEATLAVLTDGLFGFTFAAIESWQRTGAPARDALVDQLAAIVAEGFRAAVR